jgi:hypothetical protein
MSTISDPLPRCFRPPSDPLPSLLPTPPYTPLAWKAGSEAWKLPAFAFGSEGKGRTMLPVGEAMQDLHCLMEVLRLGLAVFQVE